MVSDDESDEGENEFFEPIMGTDFSIGLNQKSLMPDDFNFEFELKNGDA